MLRAEPAHADAWFLLGMIAAAAGNYGKARELIERALDLDFARAEYHAQHARVLAVLDREDAALRAAEAALRHGAADALTLDTVGVVLARLGRHERAVAAFERAVAAGDRAEFHVNLAASLKFLGRFDAAERAYEAALIRAPHLYRAHSALSDLRTQTPERNHIQRLLACLRGVGDDVDGELHLRHALAKEYEDIGDYESAFEHLERGQARKRGGLAWSIEDDRALFAAVQSTCDESFCATASAGAPGGAVHASAEPIFVVGMPRTGTTLIERILSSHSAVATVGESRRFAIELKRAAATRSNRVLDPDTVRRAAQADFAALGARYLDSTRPASSPARFVDKMPLNFLCIGFIHRALPNAKIVCLRRDPLDTCLSNFRQLFAVDFPYYNYAYDLETAGQYYVLFDALMAHWRRVLPGRVLEVRYEDLVRGQEAQTRRLLEFCELDFEPACLAFERNRSPVATASAVQVRKPMSDGSIGRWRRYEPRLAGLRAQLAAAGVCAA